MALIELRIDLKATVSCLSRIANALERICIHSGIPLSDPEPPKEPKGDQVGEEVMVETDEERLKRDLERQVAKVRDPQAEEEVQYQGEN